MINYRSSSGKRILSFVFILQIFFINISALEPVWSIDFGSVFDNSEGDGAYKEPKTTFFVTLAPEIGLKFTENDRISAGALWNQPLENNVKNSKLYPTVYYRHDGPKWKFSMGLFPMTQLREPLPAFLWCDSLSYFQQNIRGALVQYEIPQGFFDAYIDWRGMQSKTVREAFNIVFHGEWRPKKRAFLIGGHALMNHFARSKDAPAEQKVVDNFLINPYIGIDYSKKTILDSLVLKGGALFTIERDRRVGEWKAPGGFWMDIFMEWKFLGVKNSLYAGESLFPLFGEFGNLLYLGDAYYQSPFYDRLDVYARIYRNRFIELEAQLNFNFTKSHFQFNQRLIVNIEINNLKERKHKTKRLR